MAESVTENGGAAVKTSMYKAFRPQLLVQSPKASDAVVFYKAAFGAEEVDRTQHPKRKADQETPSLSVELYLSGSLFFVSDVVDDSDTA